MNNNNIHNYYSGIRVICNFSKADFYDFYAFYDDFLSH